MKVLVEFQVKHVHAQDWLPWVVEVEAPSRKAVTKNLSLIENYVLENCLGEGWTTGKSRLLGTKEAKGAAVEDQLVLDGSVVYKQGGWIPE